ncbi:MAG TPA: hypothetical protein VM029_04640 [Opitutaceae bacterium]|nr:hypothetical protein [Opitutaceae bacterium]
MIPGAWRHRHDSRCPRGRFSQACVVMGQKYLPTNKDLKAARRFQKQQHTQSKFIKPAAGRRTTDAGRQTPDDTSQGSAAGEPKRKTI